MTTTRSVLGPLITPFTYPASCLAVHPNCDTCNYGWQAQVCGTNTANSQGLQDDPACWPPVTNTKLLTAEAFGGGGFYSPGLACPTGYTSACTGSADGGFAFQYPLVASETAVGCCPEGYQCQHNSGAAQTCVNVISTGSFPTVSCSAESSLDLSVVTVPLTVATTVISKMTAYAPLIQINWQATDLVASETSTASSTSTSAHSSSATKTSTSASPTKTSYSTSASSNSTSSTSTTTKSSTTSASITSKPTVSSSTTTTATTSTSSTPATGGASGGLRTGGALMVSMLGLAFLMC